MLLVGIKAEDNKQLPKSYGNVGTQGFEECVGDEATNTGALFWGRLKFHNHPPFPPMRKAEIDLLHGAGRGGAGGQCTKI